MAKRIRVYRSFEDAQEAEIREQRAMTPAQRLEIFRRLKARVFGRSPIDVRAFHRKNKTAPAKRNALNDLLYIKPAGARTKNRPKSKSSA
jgi:hypothetical protein